MGLKSVMLDPVGLLLQPLAHPFTHSLIPKKLLRRMMLTSIWQSYQRGRITPLQEAARLLAELPFVTRARCAADDISSFLLRRRLCMRVVPWMLQLLDVLRGPPLRLRLFAVCNASTEEMQALQCQFPVLFARFDAVYTSGEEGVGRPSVRFLQLAMEKAGISAHHTLYLDSHDQLESLVAARSLGMPALCLKHSSTEDSLQVDADDLLHDALNGIRTQYMNVLSSSLPPTSPGFSIDSAERPARAHKSAIALTSPADPDHRRASCLASARQFLLEIAGAHDDPKKPSQYYPSLTSDGIQIYDNFAQFLIADLLDDIRFLPMQSSPASGLICFVNKSTKPNDTNVTRHFLASKLNPQFYASDACTFDDIPEDLDTTSIGLVALYRFGRVDLITIHKVLDKMLEYVSKDDGILQVYFDSERPRIDPVAVANAVFLFHLAERGHEVERSERFVESVLLHRAYEDGTLYYNLGEAFLWCVARLVDRFKDHFTRSGMRSLLVARLQDRRGDGRFLDQKGNALALAMHMHACSLIMCGLKGQLEEVEDRLVGLQRGDGAWDCHPYYRYGSNAQSWIGNEALTTAFAYAALV